MTHRVPAPIGLALAAVIVGACGTSAATAPPTSAAPTSAASQPSIAPSPSPIPIQKVSIQLDFTITPTTAPLLWGIDKGYFKEQGIDLDVIPGRGSDLALNQVDAGQVDFAFIDGSNYIAGRIAGVTKTTAIYTLVNISTTAIVSKTEISTPKDMMGKSFGTIPQSSGRQKIPLVLKMNGIDPKSVPIELLDYSVLYASLFEGKIDTAEVGYPGDFGSLFLSGQEQGVKLFAKSISDWGYRDYSKLLIASDKVIANDKGLVGRLVAALTRSQADAIANATPADVYRLIKAQDPQAKEASIDIDWAGIKESIKNPGPMDDATFQFQLDLLKADGTATTITPKQLYTNEFIPPG